MQNQYQGSPPIPELTPSGQSAAASIAQRHGVSAEAVIVLIGAIARGHGQQAQFSHPDLGGMGQWSRGGMLMVGDMFNQALKARVAALCEDVAVLFAGQSNQELFATTPPADTRDTARWPETLGQPASTGSQNDMHYAFFPDKRRLAIASGGEVTIYDTGDRRIGGFGQQQGDGGSITLSSQHGPVQLDALKIVDAKQADAPDAPSTTLEPVATASPDPAPSAAPALDPAPPASSTDVSTNRAMPKDHDPSVIFAKIEGIAKLHANGLLTDDEYRTKKAELLARL